MTLEQLEVYEACMNDFENMLNRSMKQNHGCVTAMDSWHVLNDVIHFTHTQKLRIQECKSQPQLVAMGGM